ncbi:MAG: cyclase family protein, partial [Acidobacteriota bacterium]
MAPAPAMALDDPWRPLEDARVIDLTHAYGDDTIYWPTETRGFQLEVLFDGMTDGGYHYAANAFCT